MTEEKLKIKYPKWQRHMQMCLDLNKLYRDKDHDYGDSFHKSFLEEGMAMPRIRLGDKYNRFCALTRSKDGLKVSDESIKDTLIDLANYAIMTLLELDDGWYEEGARDKVDPEPVIRCNICKHYETDTGYCYMHDHGMDWDGFCSRGKKMDAEVE